jgi:transcriptional regulator with XRE-family HTH domain
MTAVVVEPDQITAGDLYEYIGHHIRAYRRQRRWTQQQLADAVGRSLATVNSWEGTKAKISVADLVNVAAVFGLSVAAFLPRGAA